MNRQDEISASILTLATIRGTNKTICPSEVARKLWPDKWRDHMPQVREAAFVLRDKGEIRIMQKETEIFGNELKGPMRIQIK